MKITQPGGASSGSGGISTVTDSITTVTSATLLTFVGAVVTNGGGGNAIVTITGGSSALIIGSTTITAGTTTRILYDNAGILGEYTISGTGTVVAMANTPTLTTPVLNGTVTGTGVSQSSSASTLVQRDANQNIFINNYFANSTSTVSAGGTTVLTVASARVQTLTGSSSQTFQLPNATTLTNGNIFLFNNNSSGSLIITNNGASTLYTVPAGGYVQANLLDNGTTNGTWDFHALPPSTVTWSSGIGGLVFNTALTTTPMIATGAASATSPVFIPQRGTTNTGYSGDSTTLYGVIGGATASSLTATAFNLPYLTASQLVTTDGSKNLISSAVGTGVLTALGTNVGSAGSFVVNGGALGTPSSGTVTNLTGTASININGTVGATTPATGAFTTLSGTSTLTLGVNATTLGSIKLFGSTSGDVTIKPAAVAGTATIFQLPADNGTNGYVLQTNGSGVTSWVAGGGGGGGITVGTTTITSGTDGRIGYNNGGVYGEDSSLFFDDTNKILNVGGGTITGYTPSSTTDGIWATKNSNNYFAGLNVQNASAGTTASSDIIAYNDTGTNYINMGIASSGNTDANYTSGQANSSYLYGYGEKMTIGTGTSGKSVQIITGGTLTANIRSVWDGNGMFTTYDNSLTTTPSLTTGVTVENTTAATVGAQKISPVIRMSGKGWATTGSVSRDVSVGMYVLPVQSTTPYSQFTLAESVNGSAYASVLTINGDTSRIAFSRSDSATAIIGPSESGTGSIAAGVKGVFIGYTGNTATNSKVFSSAGAIGAITNSAGTNTFFQAVGSFTGSGTGAIDAIKWAGTVNATSTGQVTGVNITPSLTSNNALNIAGYSMSTTWANSSSSGALFKGLNFTNTINNTGTTASATFDDIFINDTETSLTGTTHNFMRLQIGGSTVYSIDNGGYNRYAGESRVTSQFDKTSSTTLGDITGLTANVKAAGVYKFRAVLFTTSNVAGGVKFAIGGTATATSVIYAAQVFETAGVTMGTARATALATAVGDVTAVTAATCIIEGTIVVNAAGTLTVQFAQNVSNGTASSVLVNSTFTVDGSN